MSTYFRLRCDLHEVDGPQIARTAGGVYLAGALPDRDDATAAHQWARFLIDHEYCTDPEQGAGLRLIHEATPPTPEGS